MKFGLTSSSIHTAERVWKLYDYGPKDQVPLVCLPGVAGTAEVFFKQITGLCPKGFRVISVRLSPF